MKRFAVLAALFWLACPLFCVAQSVYYSGPVDKGLRKEFRKAGYTEVREVAGADLAVVAGEAPVPPEERTALNEFLSGGCGNVIFLGDKAFDYSPKPVGPVRIVDFTSPKGWSTGEERREKKARFTEVPSVSVVSDDKGNPALEMKTQEDCTKDWFLKLEFRKPLDDALSVLTFRAKGNEWMDLAALEAVDDKGKTWTAFVPVTCDWADYALPLADFLPLARQSGESYELLTASRIRKLLIGVNIKHIWYEHATYLGLSEVCLARNDAPFTAPTSSLQRVSTPLRIRATALPEDIYDPAWRAANPWDMTSNGGDTKEGNLSKKDRESRIIPVGSGTVELFPEGARAGGAVAMFPSVAASSPAPDRTVLFADILRAAQLMTRTPMAVGTRMNMK